MDRVCDYCKCQFDDSLDNCPHCGAPNSYVQRRRGIPRTIEELKIWCYKKNIQPEHDARCFIDKDLKSPNTYGIYRDQSGDLIVYKNKHDGTRSVKYKGKDESYAVNEIYLKLKEQLYDKRLLQEGAELKYVKKQYANKQVHGIVIAVSILLTIIALGYIIMIVAFLATEMYPPTEYKHPYGNYEEQEPGYEATDELDD